MANLFACRLSLSRLCCQTFKLQNARHMSPVCTQWTRYQSDMPVPDRGEPSTAGDIFRGSKPITNHPFAKGLFAGEFDNSLMEFPEIYDKEELEELAALIEPVEKFFNEGLDSKSIDMNAKIPEETLQQIKDLGLFGQQIPPEYGGLGLNATKYARLAEITALDGSVAVTLAAHQAIGLKGILIAGTEEQKKQYLPKLATGENVAAFCLTEPSSGSDAASIQTHAKLSDDNKHYILNGSKIWISNGGIADIMTVFAQTSVNDPITGKPVNKITAFIVERDFGGVVSGKPEDKLGIRGSNTCEVFFEDCPVPVENVIGEVGGGFKVAMNILNSGRFSMGSSAAGILKKLIGWSCEHAMTRSQFGKKLMEFDLIKEKFAKMAATTYAMESMAYLTAGTIDGHTEPDCSVEAAIVKVFSSEGGWHCVNECLQILGGLGYMKDYPYERYLRDARILLIFEGTNEILRMFIALNGMQYAGKALKELVKKLRNPVSNPGIVFSKAFEKLFRSNNPKLRHRVHDYCHPTFGEIAEQLERRCLKFQSKVEQLLQKHGKNIVDQQIDLRRCADIAIDIYGVTACVSRASRSVCIGLRNHDHEAELTMLFAQDAFDRIDYNLTNMQLDFNHSDDIVKKVADSIFKNKGYAAEHPLTRNW